VFARQRLSRWACSPILSRCLFVALTWRGFVSLLTVSNNDEFWSGRSVLVTGAAGFAGRNLISALVRSGAKVHAVLRPGGSQAHFSDAVSILQADLRNQTAVAKLFSDVLERDGSPVDTVFHVAAVFRTVGVSRESLYESHVSTTQYLLDAGKAASIRRFLHVSTIGVQGPNPPPNAAEDDQTAPADDYQETKLEAEQLALAFGAKHSFPVTVVRPCGIYGAGDSRFLKIIRPIARGRFPFIGRGSGLFHLVHVEDLARGMLLAAQSERTPGEVLTLGGAEVPTLREFVELIAKHTGGGVLPIAVPYSLVYAAGFVCEKLCALIGIEPPLHRRRVKFFGSDRSFDLTRAKELAGYDPSVSLDAGVAGLVEWHQQRGDI